MWNPWTIASALSVCGATSWGEGGLRPLSTVPGHGGRGLCLGCRKQADDFIHLCHQRGDVHGGPQQIFTETYLIHLEFCHRRG